MVASTYRLRKSFGLWEVYNRISGHGFELTDLDAEWYAEEKGLGMVEEEREDVEDHYDYAMGCYGGCTVTVVTEERLYELSDLTLAQVNELIDMLIEEYEHNELDRAC